MSLSLCGGLGGSEFSSLLFEQSLLSYDDFAMRLQNGEDLFANPDLVVRLGEQYYTWSSACPIIMSAVLYGRALPSDLVKVDGPAKVTSHEHQSGLAFVLILVTTTSHR